MPQFNAKVKHLGSYLNGYPFAPSDWAAEGTPILRIQNLTQPLASSYNKTTVDVPDKYRVQTGDVLISWSGSLGVFRWTAPFEGWLNQHIFKVTPAPHVNQDWLYWAAMEFMKRAAGNAHGSTMQHLTLAAFGKVPVWLPPLETQKLIASYLDAKIGLMRLHSQMDKVVLHRLKAYRQSLISEVVAHGIPSDTPSTSDDTPQKKPAAWPLVALKRVVSRMSSGANPKADDLSYYGTDPSETHPWAVIADITADVQLRATKSRITAKAIADYKMEPVPTGTLVMSMYGSMGRVAITSQPTYTNTAILAIEHRPAVIQKEFLYWSLISLQNHWPTIATKTTQMNLSVEKVANTRIPLPPLDEQKAIAAYLDDKVGALDQMIAIQERRPAQHEVLIANAISEAVCGGLVPSQEVIDSLAARLVATQTELASKALADPLVAKHMRHLIPGLSAQLRSHSTGTDGTDGTAAVEPPDFDDNEELAASDVPGQEQD